MNAQGWKQPRQAEPSALRLRVSCSATVRFGFAVQFHEAVGPPGEMGFLCINIIMGSATIAEFHPWETMSSWSAVMSPTQCLCDVSGFRLATQAQGPVACGLGVISKCHCQDQCEAASPRNMARPFILYCHNHWLGAFCPEEVHLLVFESILYIRSLQRMVGNFLYFRLSNGTCSVTDLCLTIAMQILLNFPKTGSSFSLWTKK